MARQVALQAQVTGSISLHDFDVRRRFNSFKGGQELEAFKRKARKSFPDLDIEYAVLDECSDVFYMIELGRYYASDRGLK
ncbi:hypothetical protein [Ruegeria sp. HKCCA5929]|uniref:hypothetical protein n=1 Tax=Ruegeria sp. HKCCA5929 TaxID=2682988 RepID=UPI00148867F0|nr:hypothetical protein [Ruegeria sp. HKCCA5929]